MAQESREKVTGRQREEIDAEAAEAEVRAAKARALSGETAVAEVVDIDLEDLLNDIDNVLEENAEQFVKEYQQQGGQ